MKKQYNIEEMKRINAERISVFEPEYDPMLGIGSPLERREFSYTKLGIRIAYDIPVQMFSEPLIEDINGKAIERVAIRIFGASLKQFVEDLEEQIIKIRFKYDFEFWAYICVKIKDKETKNDIPFKLNYPQRRLLKDFEDQRFANQPIREIIDKARQWGGSTLTQVYMAYIQTELKTSWHSVIVADVEDQARNIRSMYSRFAKFYPAKFGNITLAPFEGSAKNKIVQERGCIMSIGSVQKPDSLRSFDLMMCHLSEVGLWKATEGKKPEDLAQSLRATVPDVPLTMVVLESTAKGVGNFFHREWQSATTKKKGYKALFVSWFEIERYRKKIDNLEKFIESWEDYHWYLWEIGATLEGINWYKSFKERENYSDLDMFQEFPSTADESFSFTGRPVFNKLYVKNAERTCIDPVWIGDISADATKYEGAFNNIRFHDRPGGDLWVWAMPDTTIKVANRYCSFVDIGGRSKGADYSVIKVLDRYWMIDGGVPEVVAVWHSRIDQDLLAWKAAQISYWYGQALMAVEVQSLRRQKDGDHYLTVLDEISDYYDNLYSRTSPEKIREGIPNVWGFHTNTKTKPMIMDTLNGALRDNGYIERDFRACAEMGMYEMKDDGTMGAPDGEHDDHVIVTAGSVWLSNKHMDLPVEIKTTFKPKKKIINESTF